ncbi:MAG: ABC transporter ATP-binding protein [Oscillospiraceae bacterium]|nr:ABC transporter ATP-binding protein [Oscillospiraceae bacterium]
MLQIQNVKKVYKTGDLVQQALDGVSLSLRDNEFVAILGPSGSGKTTLLNVIGGLDRYDSGELIINGVSTRKYSNRDWDSYRNHTVGFVFQSYNLIPHQTILANVELALTISGISRGERRRRAKEALSKVGLAAHIHKKPAQLSGGQMQRVAIARALVNDPDILLADEPTGALDSETSLQVMDLLKEVAQDRLVVMVTHNPELAEQYATRIVRLKDGKIIDDSDPFDPEAGEAPVHRNLGKSSMSLLTALSLSFNNLWTKKVRTLLVAFAGSIGIIGIAMILSMSKGVNRYIQSVEEDTLKSYPLQITDSSFNLAAFMPQKQEQPEDGEATEVWEWKTVTNLFSRVSVNDLSALRAFLESGKTDVYDQVQAICYDYNITPRIYRLVMFVPFFAFTSLMAPRTVLAVVSRTSV